MKTIESSNLFLSNRIRLRCPAIPAAPCPQSAVRTAVAWNALSYDAHEAPWGASHTAANRTNRYSLPPRLSAATQAGPTKGQMKALKRAQAGKGDGRRTETEEATGTKVRMPDGTTVAPEEIVYEKVGDAHCTDHVHDDVYRTASGGWQWVANWAARTHRAMPAAPSMPPVKGRVTSRAAHTPS